jgi:adenine-specific DNA glycosylase
MRFRLGLLLGLAIGYVLGAKAGRQRYDQILAAWRDLKGSQRAQQLSEEVRQAANRAGDVLESKVTEVSKGNGAGNDAASHSSR